MVQADLRRDERFKQSLIKMRSWGVRLSSLGSVLLSRQCLVGVGGGIDTQADGARMKCSEVSDVQAVDSMECRGLAL
jgi:hypothetical protein